MMKIEEVVKAIIREQSQIVGDQLSQVSALNSGVVAFELGDVEHLSLTESDARVTMEKLIDAYQNIFGQASVNVCISVLRKFPEDDVRRLIPKSLNFNG
jgi:hypothetical protein